MPTVHIEVPVTQETLNRLIAISRKEAVSVVTVCERALKQTADQGYTDEILIQGKI